MKKKIRHLRATPLRAIAAFILLVLAWGAGSFPSQAADSNPPGRLTYQGFLVDANGAALGFPSAKNYDVTFRLYKEASGGTALWDDQQTVTVDKGYFSVLLGEGVGSPERPELSTVFVGPDASDRYVGITVLGIGEEGSNVDILPRLRLLTSPYAFLARNASTLVSPLGSNLVTSAEGMVTVNGTVNASGGVTGLTASQIPSLDGSKITTGKLPSAAVPNNVALLDGGQTFTAPTAFNNGLTVNSGRLRVTGTAAIDTTKFTGFGMQYSTTGEGAIMSSYDDGFGYLTFYTKQGPGLPITQRMIINQSGNVGIGTSSPSARLAVVGNATVTGNVGFGTTNPGIKGKVEINGVAGNNSLLTPFGVYGKTGGFADTSYFSGNNSSGNISLHASGRILATDFLAFSDERIKRVDGRSDAARDLDTLQKIEVTDYRYIDTVSKGSGKQKKVIAQQVEKVFPQAVSRGIDAVPDIFQKAEIIDGWVQLATDLKKGDRVSLIGEKNEGVHEVLEVELERFRTDFATDGDEVFVYGREVKDFRHVDYEAIAMLNVSATQELARQLELVQSSAARLVELELKAARVEVLERQVADLERMITQLAAAGIDSQTKTPARPQDLPAASVNEVSAPAQAEH